MSDEQMMETLRFMFDKRLELFNVRREHEWKIFFGVMGLIGAVVAVLATQKLELSSDAIRWWWVVLGVLFMGSIYYQYGVQQRNRVDRLVMDELHSRLCDKINIHRLNVVRTPIDCEKIGDGLSLTQVPLLPLRHLTYLWAFLAQHILLAATCVVAVFLPEWLASTAPRSTAEGYHLVRPRVTVGAPRQAVMEQLGSPDETHLFRDKRDTVLEYRTQTGRLLLTVRSGRVAAIQEDSSGTVPRKAKQERD